MNSRTIQATHPPIPTTKISAAAFFACSVHGNGSTDMPRSMRSLTFIQADSTPLGGASPVNSMEPR
jgi:hypothetical protein